MSGYEGLPKCQAKCQFPDGVVPRYNCAGVKLMSIEDEREFFAEELQTERPEELEPRYDFVMCGNAALRSIDFFQAERLGLIRRL